MAQVPTPSWLVSSADVTLVSPVFALVVHEPLSPFQKRKRTAVRIHSHSGYIWQPRLIAATIPARDLRNHTAEVLRRVDNRPVAKIVPPPRLSQWLPASEVIRELARLGPDTTGLGKELRETLTDTTDDLSW